MKISERIKNFFSGEEMEQPLPDIQLKIFKKGKVAVCIILPDQSYRIYHKKIPNDNMFTIKTGKYLINSETILRGAKNPLVLYYYNNPEPINVKYRSTSTKLDGSTLLDAKSLKATTESKILTTMYGGGGMTPKIIIIITIVIVIFILIVLQATGQVDIVGMFASTGGGD